MKTFACIHGERHGLRGDCKRCAAIEIEMGLSGNTPEVKMDEGTKREIDDYAAEAARTTPIPQMGAMCLAYAVLRLARAIEGVPPTLPKMDPALVDLLAQYVRYK